MAVPVIHRLRHFYEAIQQASEFVGESIPVVDQKTHRLNGVITEADLFSVYLQVQKQVKAVEHG